jgi:uncharacterized membrane protein YbhN (UPF0104 family)
MPPALRKFLIVGAKLLAAGLLIWLLVRNVDLGEVFEHLRRADPAFVFACVASMSLFFAILALRWAWLCRLLDVPLGKGRAIALYFEATTFNLVLPGSVGGEVLRVWRASALFGRLRRIIAGVLFERLGNITVLVLICLTWAGLEFIEGPAGAWSSLAGLALLVWGGICLLPPLLKRGARWRRIRFAREIWRFGWLVRRRFLQPRALLGFLAFSFLAYAAVSLATAAALLAVDAPSLSAGQIFIVTALTLVGTAVPLSIAGTGFREGAMAFALTHFGLPLGIALAVAFLFSGALFLQALPGIAIWLLGLNAIGRSRKAAV